MNFIDPDGRDIRIYYNQRRNARGELIADYWDFNGKNAKDAPNAQFVQDFLLAYSYNLRNGSGDNMERAAFDVHRFDIFEVQEMETSSSSNDSGRNLIYWSSSTGLQVENGDILSAATILEHEFDHAISRIYDMANFYQRASNAKKGYRNEEEYRVITGSETKTARANGEISKNKKQSRYIYDGAFIPTESPISTKSRNTKERSGGSNKLIKGLYNYEKR